MDIKSSLDELREKFNTRPERERLTVLVGSVIFLAIFWLFTIEKPLLTELNSVKKPFAEAEKNYTTILDTYNKFKKFDEDPASEQEYLTQEKMARETFDKLDDNINLAKNIVTPDKLSQLLSLVSDAGPDLIIDQMQNLPTIKLSSPATTPKANTASPSPTAADDFQIQPVSLSLYGNYFAILSYLRKLEDLPWYIKLNNFVYQVKDYPNAKISMTLEIPVTAKVEAS